ncbi:MAG: redoxin family protein [Candidatus Latescibacterota bacterium]|nr:MAG: redoxin family protein [Candidatus Latescibacterota bacterium]
MRIRNTMTAFALMTCVVALALMTGVTVAETESGESPFALMVGDDAPAFEVNGWVQGGPIDKLERGHVYVVDFWATWCKPCVASIPHIAGLSKKYQGKATVIGMNIWQPDPAEVEPFVKNMGDKMPYAVATDVVAEGAEADTGKMAVAWMNAAGQRGIPAVFIVDANGKVAWIGHPGEMDEPLEKIVNDTWDLDTYAKTHREKMVLVAKAAPIEDRLFAASGAEKWEEAIAACDELIALDPDGYSQAAMFKFQMLLLKVGDTGRAYAYARDAMESSVGKDAWVLNGMAWYIVDPDAELAERDLDLALTLATRANEIAEGKDAAVLDTLARVYFTRGDSKKAIELQKKALTLVDDDEKAEYEKALTEYQSANQD